MQLSNRRKDVLPIRKNTDAPATTGGRRLNPFVKGALYVAGGIVVLKVALMVMAVAVSIVMTIVGIAVIAALVAAAIAMLRR